MSQPSPAQPPRILLVEDDEVDFRATRRMLTKIFGDDLSLDWARSWDEAVQKLHACAHDVYLVDYHLGGRTGLELIQETAGTGARAFIFLTGQEDHALDLAATTAGAADFLVKSDVTPSRLERSIRYAISMTRAQWVLRRQADELRRAHALVQEQAERYLKNAQDLAAAQRETRVALKRAEESEERYRLLAERDVLTGLANRAVLTSELDAAIAHARRGGHPLALLFLDLDRFKQVNDTLGHATGDRLITAVARRLVAAVRETDLVARLGGDEFAVMLTEMRDRADAAVVAAKVLAAVAEPFVIDGRTIASATSVGIALLDDGRDDAGSMLNKADIALYKAKSDGRGAYRFFDEDLDKQVKRRQRLERDMPAALTGGQFLLEFQPQVALDSGRVTAVEALVRWQHPELGRLEPEDFIPLAESSRFITALTAWVLREACICAKAWQPQLDVQLPVAVNLSALDIGRSDFADDVVAILAETGLAPALLQLEIAEPAIVNPGAQSVQQLWRLSSHGVKLAIDEFGTGYSALTRAHGLPIGKIKVARAFVADMAADRRHAGVVRAVIALARHLKVSAVVEGIETAEQLDSLSDIKGVDLQGFLVSRPLPADRMLDWLRQRPAAPARRPTRARLSLSDVAC